MRDSSILFEVWYMEKLACLNLSPDISPVGTRGIGSRISWGTKGKVRICTH